MKAQFSLLVVVAAAAAAVLAVQSTASSTPWTTERFYSKETSHSFADIGKADGGGPADVYVSQQLLADASGKRVGTVNGYGVNLTPPYVFFHYTGVIGSSTITLEGAVSLRGAAQTYAIVGGTGRYAGARGTVTTSDAGARGSLVVVRYRT
jgi:Allene oxide cyclase barrel like domain